MCLSVSHQLTSRPKLSEMVKCWFSLKHHISYTVTKVFSSLRCCWWRDSEKLMFQYKPETVAYALNHPDGSCKMASNTRVSENTSRWETWMQEWGVLLSSKVFPILSHSDQVLTAQSSQPLRMRLRQWGTSWTSLTSAKWWTDWGESWWQVSLINLVLVDVFNIWLHSYHWCAPLYLGTQMAWVYGQRHQHWMKSVHYTVYSPTGCKNSWHYTTAVAKCCTIIYVGSRHLSCFSDALGMTL